MASMIDEDHVEVDEVEFEVDDNFEYMELLSGNCCPYTVRICIYGNLNTTLTGNINFEPCTCYHCESDNYGWTRGMITEADLRKTAEISFPLLFGNFNMFPNRPIVFEVSLVYAYGIDYIPQSFLSHFTMVDTSSRGSQTWTYIPSNLNMMISTLLCHNDVEGIYLYGTLWQYIFSFLPF